MRLPNAKGVESSQFVANELLQAVDLNFYSQAAYEKFTAILGILAESGKATGSNSDIVVSGLLLEWSSALTCNLRAGAALSFQGNYFNSLGQFGFNSLSGDMFSVVVPLDSAIAFDSGSSQDRIDILEICPAMNSYNSTNRQIKDPITQTVTIALLNSKISFDFNFKITQGTPGASPSAPSGTAGYIKVAEVYVPALASAIDQTKIKDIRSSSSWTTQASKTIYAKKHAWDMDFGTVSGEISSDLIPIATQLTSLSLGTKNVGTMITTILQSLFSGQDTQTPSSYNINSITATGKYSWINAGTTNFPSGCSAGDTYILNVFSTGTGGSGIIFQQLFDLTQSGSSSFAWRRFSLNGGSTWSSWINTSPGGGFDSSWTAVLSAAVSQSGAVGVLHGKTTFLATGTWTVPVGVTSIFITGCGPGGNGGTGGSGSGKVPGAGGGGAKAVIGSLLTVIPGHLLTITIGTHGVDTTIVDTTTSTTLLTLNHGADGAAGSSTSASGGAAGGSGGGAGGSVPTGQTPQQGFPGIQAGGQIGPGLSTSSGVITAPGGAGGGGSFGSGGSGGYTENATGSDAGPGGSAGYGGGGGGGGWSNNGSGGAGGSGGPSFVELDW